MEKRVLLVEDDAVVRGEIIRALEREGVQAVVASDGVDGLARLRDAPGPLVVLLDLRSAGAEDLMREVRAEPRYAGVPVITTMDGGGRGGPEVLAQFPRPFDVDDLLAIVLSLFEANAA